VPVVPSWQKIIEVSTVSALLTDKCAGVAVSWDASEFGASIKMKSAKPYSDLVLAIVAALIASIIVAALKAAVGS